MFLPATGGSLDNIEQRVANFLNISPTGQIIEKMRWLGLFSEEKIGINARTSAEVMTHLISQRLKLTEDARDMVILLHRLEVEYPEQNNRRERIISTMINYGEKAGFSSMAKSVGLPAALVAKLLLKEKLPLSGCHIPTHPAIYTAVMEELAEEGFAFTEKRENI
jgi:saccharopine dehydrogenase-like NADP-dependent oxidoreductase